MIVDNVVDKNHTYLKYFEDQEEYELTAICENITDALNEFKKNPSEIIVSEISLNGLSGISGIQYFKRMDTGVKMVLISLKNDFELIKKAFKAGANGYLTKPLNRDRFLNALNSVKNNGAAMSHDVAKKVVDMFQKKTYHCLSKRENQIVEYLSQGATYKVIAENLFVTPSTVNFHVQNIYLKLNVNSKSEALEKLKQLESYHNDWLNMAS